MAFKQETRNAAIAVLFVLLAFSAVAIAQLGAESPEWDRFSARHDENLDGQISAEEFGRTDHRFGLLDGNDDGVVTPDELEAAHDRFGGPPPPGRGLAHMADSDGDRQITKQEWDSAVAEVDANGDGIVGPEEMVAAAERNHPGMKPGFAPPPDSMIDRLDSNDDGFLDAGDFDALFSGLDADSDGTISSEEMRGPRAGCRSRSERAHRGGARRGEGSESGFGPRGEFGGPAGPGHRHLRRADEDGDGAVTLDEWNAMLDRFDRNAIFDALDTDGDQIISGEEMAAAPGRRGLNVPQE